MCEWPNCNKGFARQHDCKRHYALHNAKPNQHVCDGCGKTFSRTDALNRHLRSDGGSGCRKNAAAGSPSKAGPSNANPAPTVSEPVPHPNDPHPPGTLNGHYPISLAVQGPPPGPSDPSIHPMHQHQLPAPGRQWRISCWIIERTTVYRGSRRSVPKSQSRFPRSDTGHS